MNYFIKNIHVNKLFHLENFDIPIANANYPHLIITGKNGSGKTILLNAIADFIDKLKTVWLYIAIKGGTIDSARNELCKESHSDTNKYLDIINSDNVIENMLEESRNSRAKEWQAFFSIVNLEFSDIKYFTQKFKEGNFVLAFYEAYRKADIIEPTNPEKPEIKNRKNAKLKSTDQFLRFLSDLKVQEALARNEKQIDDANEIDSWFKNFENLLQRIYQDDNLQLEFNYRDYTFKICTEGRKFKFTELADGYAAILDIVADLILRMQDENSLTRIYNKEGIVFIDEIETHLHLALQKIIMPILTEIFPNIQFIITTHSPFVLSSMPNAVAYDLEHKKPIENLSNYSYESLAEGYFGVRAESSDVRHRLNRVKQLLEKEELTVSETDTLKKYISDFDNIPEAVSPSLIGEYLKLKLKYVNKIKELMQ